MVNRMNDDTISRQAAIDELVKWTHLTWECLKTIYPMLNVLEKLPPTQSERKTGHWIEITSNNHTYKCSVCGRLLVNITDGKNNVVKNYPYCHCGAKMEEECENESC